jgi:hypothetical protein
VWSAVGPELRPRGSVDGARVGETPRAQRSTCRDYMCRCTITGWIDGGLGREDPVHASLSSASALIAVDRCRSETRSSFAGVEAASRLLRGASGAR